MKRHIRLIWTRLHYMILRPIYGPPVENIDVYASEMLTEFNRLHRLIFPRFFSKMRIDQDSLDNAKKELGPAIPVYVTTYIGQLEYNYFNYLYLKESLPLAAYANGLSSQQWMPGRLSRKTKITRLSKIINSGGKLPHPVSSGYIEKLIKNGKSIFVRLKTTRIHDDLFWDIPEEDIIQNLISIQKNIGETLMLVPQQFLWAKRPETPRRSAVDWIFGVRENPGRLRKLTLFWRNYKNHAIAQFCEPLNLKDFIDAHPGISDTEMAKILRYTLLSQIREERKRITGPAIKPRAWMIENIVESDLVQNEICKIANTKDKDIGDVELLAANYAKEMVSDISYTYIEYATSIMSWVFRTMYDGIHYDQGGLAKIKKIAERSPIVFVPNHLSHVDYLLISTFLYRNNVSIPHVAAGLNLAFWPLGKIFRRCGAYFIRRSFAGNPLYKAVFEAYIRILLKDGYCQEFFIEGGRSRTGKLRQPKMGMLSSLIQALLEGTASELFFVPTSITYDNVIEEEQHVEEKAGKEKTKEKLADIFRLRKYLKRRFGKIYLNFGEPVSFRQVAAKYPDQINGEERKEKIAQRTAFEIMNSLNIMKVATPSALIATAFLVEGRRGITSEKLLRNIQTIRSYLEFTGVQLSESLTMEPARSVSDTIGRMAENKIIEIHEDFDPTYYALSEEKRAVLDFQKNAIICHLLPVAYAAAGLLALLKQKGRERFKIDEVDVKIEFLRGLFMCEFASHTGIVKKETAHKAIEFLSASDMIRLDTVSEEIVITATGRDRLEVLSSIIRNYLDSYKIAYYTCSRSLRDEPIDEKGLTRLMLQNGRHLLLLGKITSPEAISKPSFENAISLFKTARFLVEELPDEGSKERIRYRWRHSNPALEELQQELEVFS